MLFIVKKVLLINQKCDDFSSVTILFVKIAVVLVVDDTLWEVKKEKTSQTAYKRQSDVYDWFYNELVS